MNNPSACRFATASSNSTPVETPFSAPIAAPDDEYDFGSVLQTLADHRTESGIDYYHSLSKWDCGHNSWSHGGTTCITLEFPEIEAQLVREIMIESTIMHYEFPTRARRTNAIMFAIPTSDHLSHDDTTRMASLLMDIIAVKGLLPNCYLSTYFFRFQIGAQVIQRGENILNRRVIEDGAGRFVQIREWVAR